MIVVTTVGAYSNNELVQAVEQITQDARFSSKRAVIFDARLSEAQLTKADIAWRVNSLAHDLWQRGFGRRMAFVIPADRPARYGVGRMIQMMTESKGFDIALFTELDAALSWGAEEAREVERNDTPP